MTLQQALDIVNTNEVGVAHNFWNVYLPAILLVNQAYPVKGYTTIEADNTYLQDAEYLEFLEDCNRQYDERNA